MAVPTQVNSQITDSVTQTNTKASASGPGPEVTAEGERSIYDMATVSTRLSGLTDLLNRRKGLK